MSEEEKKILKTFKIEVEREQKDYSRVNSYTQFLYDNRKAILSLIEKQEKELETHKKMCEKLAKNFINVEYYSNKVGILIEWARKEVENEKE